MYPIRLKRFAVCDLSMRIPRRVLGGAVLWAAFGHCIAQGLAPDGCPIFHCTPEATGVIAQPFIPAVLTITTNASLGSLPWQGCSGNGTVLTCLFAADDATGMAKGTLKVLDATTLEPIWGSAGVADSYDLKAETSADGQVPVNFSDGSIAAGDAHDFVLYGATGIVIGKLPLPSGGSKNFGLTPLSDTYGVVSQENAQLTLINLSTWQRVNTLTLRDPLTNDPLHLVSPSSGTSGVLYAIAQNPITRNGFLFSLVIDPTTSQLSVSSSFEFTGKSGASPVIVTRDISGLPSNLVLVGVPGLLGDAKPQNRLLGLLDTQTSGLTPSWAVALGAAIDVAPTIDQASLSLFYHEESNPVLHQNDLTTGAPISQFDIRTIGGYPLSFKLNGHLGASGSGSTFTLLLAGDYITSPGVGAQMVIAFQPIASPRAVLWSAQISTVPARYLAAWNFAPSVQTGIACPIALSETNGRSAITRLCNF
jgi:hypothetical protein